MLVDRMRLICVGLQDGAKVNPTPDLVADLWTSFAIRLSLQKFPLDTQMKCRTMSALGSKRELKGSRMEQLKFSESSW